MARFPDHENETPEELSFKLDEATSVPTSDHSFPESHHTSIVDSEGDGDEETIENLSQALNASAQNHLSPVSASSPINTTPVLFALTIGC